MDSDAQKTTIYIILAFGSLLVGACVYVFDRQPATTYFMQDWFLGDGGAYLVFGWLGNYLPTFFHVYAFILLTVAVIAPSRGVVALICIGWFVFDAVMEIGQLDAVAYRIASAVPEWFGKVPILENVSDYFLSGIFDVRDVYSVAIGAIMAYLTVLIGPLVSKHGG